MAQRTQSAPMTQRELEGWLGTLSPGSTVDIHRLAPGAWESGTPEADHGQFICSGVVHQCLSTFFLIAPDNSAVGYLRFGRGTGWNSDRFCIRPFPSPLRTEEGMNR